MQDAELSAGKRRRSGVIRYELLAIVIASFLLLAYSIYFLNHFRMDGYVTSYFPWRFHVVYTDPGSVIRLFELGLGVSLFFILVSSASLVLFTRQGKNVAVTDHVASDASNSTNPQTLEQTSTQVNLQPQPETVEEPARPVILPVENVSDLSERTRDQLVTPSVPSKLQSEETKVSIPSVTALASSANIGAAQKNEQKVEEKKLSIPSFNTQEPVLEKLRKRAGVRSDTGAAVLLVLSACLLVISYRFPGLIVAELDSLIAFVGGIALLFKDQRHAVQTRLVNRILTSQREFVDSLSPQPLRDTPWSYVPLGPGISDVIVVPSNQTTTLAAAIEHAPGVQIPDDLPKLVPPGRGLAQLFKREIALEKITIEEFLTSAPSILTNSFELASSVNAKYLPDKFVFTVVHPTLKEFCATGSRDKEGGLVGCELCSLLAVLVCSITRRETIVGGCEHDERNDTSKLELSLGETFREAPKEDVQE